MPMKVNMKIRGDAMIYEAKGAWHVTFITDSCHKLNLSVDGGAPVSLRSPGVTRFVSVVPYNPVDGSRTFGPKSGSILNVSDPKLHGKSGSDSNLYTMQSSPSDRELIHLTIPIGKVDGADHVADYWYKEYPNGVKKFLGQETATTVTVQFELNQGQGLGMIISDKNGSSAENYRYKSRLVMEFDNDCAGTGSTEDFLHYYDWICDKRSNAHSQIRFVAGKAGAKAGKKGSTILSATGNCDPVGSWPAPRGG